jgi:Leucine-rich repeat (LRR) protein
MLNPVQATALDGIYAKCCAGSTSCAAWTKAKEKGYDPCHWGLARCTKANETKLLNLQALNLDCELGSSDVDAFGSSLRRLFVGWNTALRLADENATIGLLKTLPHLTEIDVTGVDLQKRTVDGLCDVSVTADLVRIGLSSANVSGALPQCVVNKPELEVLALQHNYLTGTLPQLPSSSKLRVLYLHEQKSADSINGTLPQSYVNSTTLEHLYLTDLKLSGEVSDEFSPSGVWRNIFLDKNDFNGTIPITLGEMQYLAGLDLSFNGFSGPVPAGIYDHPNRTLVYLASNKLTRLSVSSSYDPPGASLERLDASKNLVNESGVAKIFTRMPNLQRLDLNDNKLHGVILDDSTTPVWTLRKLDVSKNYLEGDIPGASYWGNIFQPSAPTGRVFDVSQNLYTKAPSWFDAFSRDSGLTLKTGSSLYDPSSDADTALSSANASRRASKFMVALLVIALITIIGLGASLGVYIWRQRRIHSFVK